MTNATMLRSNRIAGKSRCPWGSACCGSGTTRRTAKRRERQTFKRDLARGAYRVDEQEN